MTCAFASYLPVAGLTTEALSAFTVLKPEGKVQSTLVPSIVSTVMVLGCEAVRTAPCENDAGRSARTDTTLEEVDLIPSANAETLRLSALPDVIRRNVANDLPAGIVTDLASAEPSLEDESETAVSSDASTGLPSLSASWTTPI